MSTTYDSLLLFSSLFGLNLAVHYAKEPDHERFARC
jgi:hypothetical protein